MKKEKKRLLLDLAVVLCCTALCLVLLNGVFPKGPVAMAAAPTNETSASGIRVAKVEKTGSGVTMLTAKDWESAYPEIYASYMKNSENDYVEDYVENYPMIAKLFEGYGFAKSYGGARGHTYVIDDVTGTGRPHAMANCFTCKTPNMTVLANELGDEAYSKPFEDVLQQVNEPLSCYNCHGNTGSTLMVTHQYLAKAMGSDLSKVDAATLTCAQCHVDYYFDPATKAVTLPYTSLANMNPDDILDYYNNLTVDGQPFADYVQTSSGVRQIMINHPEYETFAGKGSVHYGTFTCADCHMGKTTDENGKTYPNHYLTSPLNNQELIESTCSACHTDLAGFVKGIQDKVEERTYDIGYQLEDLINKVAEAAESGEYTEEELDAIRMSYRNAQFYWNFVFVENSEGAHNSKLTHECLDKSEALIADTLALFHAA